MPPAGADGHDPDRPTRGCVVGHHAAVDHDGDGGPTREPDTGRPAVDCVVFDLGGVLLDWDPRHLYRKLFADEADMERFLAEICTPAWHLDHDAGEPMLPSCLRLAESHPERRDLIMAWAERSEEMIGGVFEDTVDVLAELVADNVPCFTLSNMEAETFPLRLARFEFLRWFDGHVISGLERVTKPDLRIFALLVSRFGLQPAHTLFVDDRQENVDAASRAGFRAVRFVSATRLRDTLVALGVLPLRSR